MMASSKAALAPTVGVTSLWTWPIEITNYDRRSRLTATEQRVLTRDLPLAVANERTIGAMLGRLSRLDRLLAPIDDALAAIDGTHLYDDRVRLMLLQHCAVRHQSFWAWDATAWHIVLGTTQAAFFAAHVPKPHAGGERHALIAVAYLLRCFNDIPDLGEVKRVALAEKIFGKERLAGTLRRVTEVSAAWGYRSPCKPLMSLLAELLLVQQQPELESLTGEFIVSVRARWHNSNYRSSLYFQLARVLASLGILSEEPAVRNGIDRESIHVARISGIATDWVSMIERWEATSTLTASSRRHLRDMVLKAGRWLTASHPEIIRADQWTRELAADYVGAVERMHVGDYIWRTAAVARKLGKPITARSKNAFLGAMRCFFADLQEWEWIPRRFDPFRAFATPRSTKALIGPAPRTIADDLWAKLLWAGLNLTLDDLPGHGGNASGRRHPTGSIRRAGGYYPLEMLQALSIVWLFAGLRSDEIVRLRVGCVRDEPSIAQPGTQCRMLDVPVHKTGTAFSKPIDKVVGEAIAAWERVRPVQPVALDVKTGEQVDFLFSYRARAIPRAYLNRYLIPLLCRKAGIPCADARGQISSHRARSTIASQLFNAREPMNLFELQAWLGHRSPATTQHYVAFTPTRLARAYSEAQYFQRNLRMMDVLIDRQAIDDGRTDQPWRYYDLGHGLCSYEFFDQCPHRMACARCDFYVPKDSSRADLLSSKTGMIRMLQEIPLTDDERAAIEGDQEAVDRLIRHLEGAPTPDRLATPNTKKQR
ncbi:tyrosine-type recombinase/integrase [Paraburkholderia madseniana]|uniref:tyrosine-type recombinase/integrase n=1 Tax=Paraburkholderia madseniana TaxID=2599607 RepID=UPI0038BD0788